MKLLLIGLSVAVKGILVYCPSVTNLIGYFWATLGLVMSDAMVVESVR
jgi:hypothetical protein